MSPENSSSKHDTGCSNAQFAAAAVLPDWQQVLDRTREVIILMMDQEGRVLVANEAAKNRLGGSDGDDETSANFLSRIDFPGQAEFLTRLARAFDGEEQNIQFSLPTNPKGTCRWFQGSIIPPGDKARGAMVILQDVTESWRREEERRQDSSVDEKPSAAELRENREHFETLVNSVDGIVWEADAQTLGFSFVSPQAESIIGFPVEDWLQQGFWSSRIHPDDRERTVSSCRELTSKGLDHEFDYRMIAADGRTVWLRDYVSVETKNGVPVRVRGIMVDITEKRATEQRLHHLNRTHAVLSGINQLIVREQDMTSLLMNGCRIAVEDGKFVAAWIGMMDPEDGALKMVGHAGIADEAVEVLKGMLGDGSTPPECGFTARSLQRGNCEVCNDVATDPESVLWRDLALGLGYYSLASLPITDGDKIVGNFNLYSSEVGYFDEEEMKLLRELSEDLSFALKVHQQEVQRQKAERELRESESKLSQSLGLAGLCHWEFKPETQTIRYDGRMCDLLRIPASDDGFYEMPIKEFRHRFCHPDDIPKIQKTVGGVVSGTIPAESGTYMEYRVFRGDGGLGWFVAKLFAETDDSGKVTRVYGITQDITERRQAEEGVKRAERRFRSLIEHSSDFIVLTGESGRISYASPSVESADGYSFKERLGTEFSASVHTDDRPVFLAQFDRIVKRPGESVNLSWRGQHRDGSWRWLEGVATNLLSDPDVEAVVFNFRDVSSRKQLEEEFRQSQKMEAIGQLAGGVAHDFNNLLTIIQGYGSLLMAQSTEDQSQEEASRQIVQAAERAAGLTRQLLAFSRRQVIQSRELDLNENVAQLTDMLRRIVGEDVELFIEMDEHELVTRADPGMIDQLLMNLVVNARDAMPVGGKLTIATSAQTFERESKDRPRDLAPGNYVGLAVKDTGIGIPAACLERIFEPFYTTKEPGQGTGLGLATVFGIVKQHGGAVLVDSEPGTGTEFRILLPAVEPKIQTQPESSGNNGGKCTAHGHETILLVEDEDAVRNLGRSVLERAGYDVIVAPSGAEAIKIWEEEKRKIDLLFTDIVMPGGKDGFELAEILQAENRQLKVVFISGYSAAIAGRELVLKEGQNFIQKPCVPKTMLEVVRNCLDQSRETDPSSNGCLDDEQSSPKLAS